MKEKILHILLLIALSGVTFFVNNATIHTDIMESRNIVTAREMVYDGNWMVPTMNGDLRLEKPPLPTWLAAVAEMVSPNNMAAQRAMAGGAATLLVVFFYLLGRELTRSDRFSLIASLVLLTSYNIILMGRTATWDIYCHAFMLAAIFFLHRALFTKGPQWGNFIAAGIMLGLSFLSKGPVSFYALLLPFLLTLLCCKRPSMKKKGGAFIAMILTCLLLSVWWYAYVYLFHSEAAQAVLHKESSAWVDHNVRPWYYYWSFFCETGIWALMVIFSLLVPYWHRELKLNREYLFTLLWMLLLVVLLSCLPEKKMRYLLPMLIPAAYTVAFLFNHWIDASRSLRWKGFGKRLFLVNGWLVAVIVAALPVVGYLLLTPEGTVSATHFIWITPLLWGVAVFLVRSLLVARPDLFVWGVGALFLIAETLFMPFIGALVNNPDFKSISQTQQVEALNGLPFYHPADEELRIEMVYEANRKIRPLDITDPTAVEAALPCAILTHQPVEELLPPAVMKRITTEYIDRYDNNRRPKSNKRYSEQFLYQVTVLR